MTLSAAGFDAGGLHDVQIADRLPFALDRGDEAVAAPMQRLDEPRIVGIVAERRAQPLDRRIQAVLEIDERPGRPQALAQLFARHDFARTVEHRHENFEGLILKPDADSTLPQLARAHIDLEGPESLDVRRRRSTAASE